MKINRRQTVVGLTSALLLPAAHGAARPAAASTVFAHGVASGDPAMTSVVLWTRVSGQSGPVDVKWSISSDPDMRRIAASGTASTDAGRDYTVKVVPDGLFAGTTYFYSFEAAGTRSPIGRTRTLPGFSLDRLGIAIASCSHYGFGHFNAYEAIARDPNIDIVIHLGDYIYEYGENGYGGATGRSLGRAPAPRHETVSLQDYRTRHAQYKADPGSRAMHAAHPLIATWDDHESANNPWRGGAQNHQPGEGDWSERRAVSLQAFYEWMPVREPDGGRSREQRWEHFRFGNLASVIALETRHTGRSEEIDLDRHADRLTDPAAARRFFDEVVGAEERRMLSAKMEQFLRAELSESVKSGRRWRIIANQTRLAPVIMPDVDDARFRKFARRAPPGHRATLDKFARYGELGIPKNMDAWDGYPAARERFYRIAAEAGARDLLVITGDTHEFWQNRLADAAGVPMGVELGTTGITSPRGNPELGEPILTRLSELITERNDSVIWTDGRFQGYIRLTLTPGHAQADYIAVSTVHSTDYKVRSVRSVLIVSDGDTLAYGPR